MKQARNRVRRAVGAGVAIAVAITAAGASFGLGTVAATADTGTAEAMSPATAPDAPWTKTVSWLVNHMTPAEELNLIEGNWSNKTNVDVTIDPDNHGQAGYVRGVKRLGIPEVRHADALGIEAFADSTAYPTRLGIAASFDRDAFNQFGTQVGEDAQGMDMDLVYGPQVDLARTPSWSRNMTAFSEDPYLASQLTAQEINGIQSTGTLSQVKHVSFYSGQSQSTPSIVDQQAAHEIYLAPAEAAAKDAGVSSMMCSYATFQIKGFEDKPDYACSNSGLLTSIVKGQWGFTGWITTDYGGGKAVSDLLAGTDQEFLTTFLSESALLPLIDPTSDQYSGTYANAAQNSVSRILYQYERFGLLDNTYIPQSARSNVAQHGNVDATDNTIRVDKVAGIAEALKLAQASATLLKNDASVLPLSKSATVAVSGQSARLLPAGPGGERANGFGDRINITPLKAMTAIAGASVTSVPGIDVLGDTVPAGSLSVDADGTLPGLTRTAVDATSATTTTTDAVLDGRQTNIAKGSTVTWTGYVNVATADTYRLLLQRPTGQDLGADGSYNQNIRNSSNSTLTVAVDGTTKQLSNPDSKILANAYPTFAAGTAVKTTAANGQYLGYQNVATTLALAPGRHQITITYKPSALAATTPTLRFAWSPLTSALQSAVDAAATNDVSVVYADDANAVTGDGVSPQTDVAQLSVAQNTLITQVAAAAHAAGHKVVVVLNTGGAVQMPWIDSVDSVLEMWYPGQEGGTATANTLYGKSDPSGKLTLSFPKNSTEDLFGGHPERGSGTKDAGEATTTIKWTEGLNIGYKWFQSAENTNGYKPLFAFGHGLSYTSFGYSAPSVKVAPDGGLNVTFTVTNTGSRSGAESPQVYVGPSSQLPAEIKQPPIKLVQFDHIELAAAQSKTLTLHVAPRDLSSWSDSSQNWVLGTGDRAISIGSASDDIRLTATKNVPATVSAPVVTTNPVANVTAIDGSSVTLTAAATGSPAPTTVWQKSLDGGKSWTNATSGDSISFTFTAKLAETKAQYRAVFSNELGDTISSVTTVTVTAATTAPVVSVNPVKAIKVAAGAKVAMKAIATGTPSPTVVWQKRANSAASWKAIAGARSTTLRFVAKITDDNSQYRAVFTNSAGTVSSTTAVLDVVKASARVTATLPKKTVSTKSAVKVAVVVAATNGVATDGKVTVSLVRSGHTVTTVTGTVRNGTVTITIPKIKTAATYTVKVTYAGNASVTSANARALTLRVIR